MLLVKWRGIGHFNIQIRTALCTAELQASPDTSSVTDTRTTCRHKNRVPSKKPLYTYIFIQSIVCMAMISWVFQDTSNRVSLKLFTTWCPSRLDNDPISCYRTLNGSFFRGEPFVQGIPKKQHRHTYKMREIRVAGRSVLIVYSHCGVASKLGRPYHKILWQIMSSHLRYSNGSPSPKDWHGLSGHPTWLPGHLHFRCPRFLDDFPSRNRR